MTETSTNTGLSERELAILAFEQEWWRHAGARDEAIWERFELAPGEYRRALAELIDRPEAETAEPVLVRRLRRQRTQRLRSRQAGRD